ncbi:hypothetical protein BH11VER1_BH11VER1_37470 [soil metagenome]
MGITWKNTDIWKSVYSPTESACPDVGNLKRQIWKQLSESKEIIQPGPRNA